MMKGSQIIIYLLLLACFVASAQAEQVTLLVTAQWTNVQRQGSVELKPNDSVLDVLRRSMSVESGFGGSFVTRLDGIPEQARSDSSWFYYINGVLANQGAAAYRPHAGDHIWWEYHSWQLGRITPALIGAFPEPFLSGANGQLLPTVICASKDFFEIARKLESLLEELGVNDVSVQDQACAALERRAASIILIGEWPALSKLKILNELYEAPSKTGFSIRFTPQGAPYPAARPEDSKANVQSGAIIAVGSAFSGSPLWLITGSVKSAVDNSVKILLEQRDLISQKVGVIVKNQSVINVY